MSSTANIRNFATLYAWDEDYPRVRWIEMKNISKNADWGGIFKAVVTLHRDKCGRARRVWTPFSGGEPTKKELAVEWPEDEQADVQRKLRDSREIFYEDYQDDKKLFMVTEKLGVDGRRFWREVISKGESTVEEYFLGWNEI